MQVITQRFGTDSAVFSAEIFARRTVAAVQLINVVNQINNFVMGQVFIQPAAKLRCKIIFAVRKRTGAAEPAHNIAGHAAQAVVYLFLRQRAFALLNGVSFLQNNHF